MNTLPFSTYHLKTSKLSDHHASLPDNLITEACEVKLSFIHFILKKAHH